MSHPGCNDKISRAGDARPLVKPETNGAPDPYRGEVLAPCVLAGAFIYFCLASTALCGPPNGPESSPVDVQELVRSLSWNQVHAMQHPAHHYQYVHRDRERSGSKTTLEIETTRGVVTRTLELSGKPPTEKQCRQNLAQLARLARIPSQQRSQYKQQQADLSRRETLFRAMPKALLYQFDGVEKNGWIRLKYRPNPAFSPHGRVESILQGLTGTLVADPKTQRLVKIDGRLVKSVTIGWGILAKLNPGGRFIMEQTELPDGEWRLASLYVRFRGSVLLVKSLNVNMKETYSSFKEVARNLTVPEAVKMLDRAPVHCGK
ncbi:MAG: hypothetical protein ACRD1J_01495 [Terriglobia bacterium]